MKNISLQTEYSKNGSYIQLCLPIETDCFIPVDDSVRLLDQVLEEIDYKKLYLAYSSNGRNPAVEPKTLFKILVYANAQGIYGSREIERACRMNLAFRWLLQGQDAPDHNTISRFRKERLSNCIEDLFTQLVQVLSNLGEVPFANLFVDGTKIEANANKYTFVWKKASQKSEVKLQEKTRAFFLEKLGNPELPEYITASFMEEVKSAWMEEARKFDVTFVHGIGRQKSPLQRDIETVNEFATRQAKYEYNNKQFRERNSFSKTDPDATFMHLKEDHMRNSQLKPAYNVQVAVESEYIVGVDISAERNDVHTLIPFLNRIRKNYGRNFEHLVADAGYESEENYHYLEEQGITPYIKPSNYEYSKTRKFQRDMEFRLAMTYVPEQDTYLCKEGRTLSFHSMKTRTATTGYRSQAKIYQCDSCEGCPHLGKCYKGKYSKKLEVGEQFDLYRAQSMENITSEEGIKLRVNRSIQAEGVFGLTKQNYGFTRFLTRGEPNVRTEYLLLALGFNLNKLHSRIQTGRIGQALFTVSTAA